MARLRGGLQRARQELWGKIQAAVGGGRVDPQSLEELEEALLQADVGAVEAARLIEEVRRLARQERVGAAQVAAILQTRVAQELAGAERALGIAATPPTVILMVGVNGTGKTTTAGKLAYRLRQGGASVLLAAADTFRAAAAEQLAVWAERAGADLVRHTAGGDPAAVVFDAVEAARARGVDYVLCDTAGRLHNKAHLMSELQKIVRVAGRACPGAPHEILLVLDASTGQNAIQQARVFTEAVAVTGLILAKLDTSARGGAVLPIHRSLGLPVLFVGLGEGLEDLQPFSARDFAAALLAPEAQGSL